MPSTAHRDSFGLHNRIPTMQAELVVEHLKMKGWRIARRMPSVAFRTFWEPIFNASQILAFVASAIGTFLILRLPDAARAAQEISSWIIALKAFGIVLVGWAVISLLRAPFIVIRQDRAKGKWFGNRFVYNEPLLLAVFRCKPTGDVEMHQFKVPEVEPGSYINYKIELDGGHALAEIGLSGTAMIGPIPYRNWPGTGGTLLPANRQAVFQIRLPTNAVAITARIYCRNFIVGKHDDQDGESGNFRIQSGSKVVA